MAEKTFDIIEDAIEKEQDFAIFKLPGSDTLEYIIGERCRALDSIEELDHCKGFIMAPFSKDASHPVIVMEGDFHQMQLETQDSPAAPVPSSPSHTDQEAKSQYLQHFKHFKAAINSEKFKKLVLSRRTEKPHPWPIQALELFHRACRTYRDSYVYLCQSSYSGMWLGSTPEIILSGNGAEWRTVALAGTIPSVSGKPSHPWDPKNIGEQAYVASYIRNILNDAGLEPEENGPFTVHAGRLCHLKTEFNFHLKDKGMAASLLNSLHPTPAVCGLPKKEAQDFILKNEGYDRKWYSGFIGKYDPAGRTDLYVNLRCMEISKEKFVFYAGGGLVKESEAEKEWMETENKLDTMRSLI